jgi:hypothetical protein
MVRRGRVVASRSFEALRMAPVRLDLIAHIRRIGSMRAVFAFVAIVAAFAASPQATSATSSAHASRTSRTVVFGLDAGRHVFTMRQPRGVVLLTRLTVTHGIRASADARIPGVAGVRVSTTSACRRGAVDVCTQSQEWCPMPRAAWRVHLRKTAGPAGVVRFDFVVGRPRR